MHVTEDHSVDSQLVAALRTVCDKAAMPNPLPCTVSEYDPVIAPLVRRLALTSAESRDKACVKEPDKDPMVATTLVEAAEELARMQSTRVELCHMVDSQAVLEIPLVMV